MNYRSIGALLTHAASQYVRDGVVDAYVQACLAREGYMLEALETDIEAILAENTEES